MQNENFKEGVARSAGAQMIMLLNVGIIGLGRWGPNHARNFAALPSAHLGAAVDTNQETLDKFRKNYPRVDCYTDYKELLARDDIDAVVVATPTGTHFEIVRAALNAGKHVLCEKPITTKSADAWELARLAEEKGVQLMVGHVFLFNSGIQYMADAVREGSSGKPFYINAVRTNLGPFRYDVNAAWDLASHDIYIFNHVLNNRPHAVSAAGGSYLNAPVEDIVFLTLFYPNGVIGHIHVSWLDPKKVRWITLVGEKQMLTWNDLGTVGPVMVHDRSVVREPTYETFGEFQLLAREGDVVIPRIPSSEPLASQAAAFLDRCMNGGQNASKGSAVEGAEVVDILEAASLSLKECGRQIEVTYGK